MAYGKGSGAFGNLPPGMGVKPSAPVGPGNSSRGGVAPKGSPLAPIGPGKFKTKPSPKVPPVGLTGSKNVNKLNPIVETGTPSKGKSAPRFKGLPGREGGVKSKKASKSSGSAMGGKVKFAAGVPPGFGP